MGQEITVTARAGASPTVRIFDCNRSITGMAIESYTVARGHRRRPSARRARPAPLRPRRHPGDRVLERGDGRGPEDRWPTLEGQVEETIQHLFGYYGDDAGWSPDSLRAIGVEPVFPPEPAAE